jgi:spermidine/putrescine transport system permease protein
VAEIATAAAVPEARPRRRLRSAAGTVGMLLPGTGWLLLFFLVPLYYVFLFSTGLRWQGVTKAAAVVNGELTHFSWSLWSGLLAPDVSLGVLGGSVALPLWAVGLAELALLGLALFGSRLGEAGRYVVPVSLVLLVLPYLALPLGHSLHRFAGFTSPDNPSMSLFFRSVSMSFTVSVAAVLLAFPIAYFLAFCMGTSKYRWIVVVIAPFLTSYLLRVLAFKVILTDQGLVNTLLFDTGLRNRDNPVDWLLYSQFTVFVVLLYAWVPFVALPIFVSLENQDRRLLEAATDLGASRLLAFRRVTLPLAAPGIVAAFLFIFIPTIGEFVTPQLVGGSEGYLFGSAIADDFGQNNDWQSGAVLALFLISVVVVLTAATSRFLRATGGGS